jgi:CRP/FNR family cyclic AMP-dependent transcriptional regulator
MATTVEALAEVPLFAQLEEAERALLAERVDILEMHEGETLFEFGEPGDWMCVLKSGAVDMSVRTKTGERMFLETAEAGDFFGEISLLDGGPRTATATVTKSGEAIVIDRDDLDELLRIRPAAAMNLLIATGKRLRVNASLLRNTASRNVNDQIEIKSNVVIRIADWVANFSGSITFLILHVIIFAIWIALNVGVFEFGDFDPFPFGLLTMAVSLEAIILSTLLLFSSNRQVARDKIRNDTEYEINLKAELQIQHLHEKIDQIQAQILSRLDALDPKRRPPGSLPADLSG